MRNQLIASYSNSGSLWRPILIAFALAALLTGPALVPPSAQAQTYHVLYSFTGILDGATPDGTLLVDADGNLYGTTTYGGTGRCRNEYGGLTGCGTVFKLTQSGTETVLHNFARGMGGEYPEGNLARDDAGNFYGATTYGGDGSCGGGCGTLFKLSKSGKLKVLYSFAGCGDGILPVAGVIRDRKGTLYGTTYDGGGWRRCHSYWGCGTVFELDKNGRERLLHRFTGDDGDYPMAGVVRDANGNLYGTTWAGGPGGYGTVFRIAKPRKETILYGFRGGSDGGFVSAGVILDPLGNLYGATQSGGDLTCDNGYGCGTVFKLNTMGKKTELYSFAGGADGIYPNVSLVMDRAGNLYGATIAGGNGQCVSGDQPGCGIAFKVDPKGKETVLHRFVGGSDGAFPQAALTLDDKGNIYGTTTEGGASGWGTVFEITP